MNAGASRCRPLLGTLVSIRVDGAANERAAHDAIDAAFAAVDHVHTCMSFHASDSDTFRLNLDAHRRPVRVDQATFEVLRFAIELGTATGGLFDPTIAPALMRWGYLPRHFDRSGGSLSDVELGDDRSVRFARPLAMDFGGIAKGYAVDRAAAAIEAHGLRRYVVNAGGDLRIGAASELIFVRTDGGRPRPLGRFTSCAIATSDPTPGGRTVRGRRVHPIVDPRNSAPARYDKAVCVAAVHGMVADALTKVAAIAPDAARQIATRYGARILEVRAGLASAVDDRRTA